MWMDRGKVMEEVLVFDTGEFKAVARGSHLLHNIWLDNDDCTRHEQV